MKDRDLIPILEAQEKLGCIECNSIESTPPGLMPQIQLCKRLLKVAQNFDKVRLKTKGSQAMTVVQHTHCSNTPFWGTAAEVIRATQRQAGSATPNAMHNAGPWRTEFGKLLPRVKLMVTARRRPDVSVEFFHDYWLNHHGPLVTRLAPTLRIQRYVQNHSVDSEAGRMFLGGRDAAQASFDGLAEGWWDNEQDMIEAFTSAEGQKASGLLAEDERNFCSSDNLVLVAYAYEFVRGPAALAM